MLVESPLEVERFERAAHDVHPGDPRFVRDSLDDLRASWDPSLNPACAAGGAIARWIAVDHEDPTRPVRGRIAAFVADASRRDPLGFFGFFLCEDNPHTARALLAAAQSWLSSHGATCVEGPVNFGERDRCTGLLVDGFDPPLDLEPFHLPHYRSLLLDAGFAPYSEVHTLSVLRARIDPSSREALARVAARVRARDPSLRVGELDSAPLEATLNGLFALYRESFSSSGRARMMSRGDVEAIAMRYAARLEPGSLALCWSSDRLVGAMVALRELGRDHEFKGVLFAVSPEHRTRGVDALLVEHILQHIGGGRPDVTLHCAGISGQSAAMHALLARRLSAARTRLHVVWRRSLAGATITPLALPGYSSLDAR